MYESAIRVIERFNRKAALLNESCFIAAVRNGAGIKSIRGERGKGSVVDYELPDREELHAYLLTLRLFDQPRDGLSLAKMAELHTQLPIPSPLVERSKAIAEDWDVYTAARSRLVLDKFKPTRRQVFDILMYGGHVHANEDKEPLFLKWTADDCVRVLTEDEFIDILARFTQAIFWMRLVNLDILPHLQSEPITGASDA